MLCLRQRPSHPPRITETVQAGISPAIAQEYRRTDGWSVLRPLVAPGEGQGQKVRRVPGKRGNMESRQATWPLWISAHYKEGEGI